MEKIVLSRKAVRNLQEFLLLKDPKNRLHPKFDITSFNGFYGDYKTVKGIKYCGTHGCLAGEMPGLPLFKKTAKFGEAGELIIKLNGEWTADIDSNNLSMFLGLPTILTSVLFWLGKRTSFKGIKQANFSADLETALKRIEDVLERAEVDE